MPTLDEVKTKLGLVLGDAALASVLVEAGYDTPLKIKAAEDDDLRAVTDDLAKVRAVFPKA